MTLNMACFSYRCLLLVFLLTKSPSMAESSSAVPEVVSASLDEDVTLSCFDSRGTGRESCYRVKWTKYGKDGSNPVVILARPETPKLPDAKRVKWEAAENGQTCLLLTNLQNSDQGLYSCEVWHGWDRVSTTSISLRVKECKALTPVRTAPGASVNLSCSVNLTLAQNVSWEMLKGGKPVSLSAQRVHVSGTTLSISSVSVSHSGWYRCQYNLGPVQRCFDINLLVQEEGVAQVTTAKESTSVPTTIETVSKTKHGSKEVFLSFVVPVVVGIIIIGLIITALAFYCKDQTQLVAQEPQQNPDTFTVESGDTYENPEDYIIQVENRLYDNHQHEEMLTFNF